MRGITRAAILLIATCAIDANAQLQQNSQAALRSEDSKGAVVLVALFQPIYPSVARLANITGDVQLKVIIRKNGSVESASVVNGSPMLQQAALNSARQSRFECRGCEQDLTPHSLVYSFQLISSPGYPCPEGGWLHVLQFDSHITIMAEPPLVHPYFSYIAARSAKCLYLWPCGRRSGGEEYYFYRVRSAKCLGLWNCGYRLREPFATCKKLHRDLAY